MLSCPDIVSIPLQGALPLLFQQAGYGAQRTSAIRGEEGSPARRNNRVATGFPGKVWSDRLEIMENHDSKPNGWTPEQIALGRRWVRVWQEAGPELERIRREELRSLDPEQAISLLCGPADYFTPPRAPKPTSGLIEQQRWFMKAARRE